MMREVQAAVHNMVVPYEESVVEELIVERRQEAARKEAEDRKWREASSPR